MLKIRRIKVKRILTALVTAFFATSAFCFQVVNNATDHNIFQSQMEQQPVQNLILQKSNVKSEKLAGHYSHVSHASHASHASHFSSRY